MVKGEGEGGGGGSHMVLWYYLMSTGTFYMSVLTVVKIYYCLGTGCALSYHEKLI